MTGEPRPARHDPNRPIPLIPSPKVLKFFLLNALLLDRGEDADSNPTEGPTTPGDAMSRRGRQSAPPPRSTQGPPSPVAPEPPKASTWDTAWERARERYKAFRPGTETDNEPEEPMTGEPRPARHDPNRPIPLIPSPKAPKEGK